MYKGTTPTFTLTLPEEVDLTQASNVYVTFTRKDKSILLNKTGSDLEIDANTVSIYLNQEETLKFPEGHILIQINWTYTEGTTVKRACSEQASVYIKGNLYEAVIA